MGSHEAVYTYLDARGVVVQPVGGNFRVQCPLHSERTASFWLYADGHYHCYGCKAHGAGYGGLIKLIQQIEGVDVRQARATADALLAAGQQPGARRPANEDEEARTPRNRPMTPHERDVMTLMAEHFHSRYEHRFIGKRARDYVTRERGIQGPCLPALTQHLGFAPSGYRWSLKEALAPLYPDWEQVATRLGVLSRTGRERLYDRVMFFVRDEQGRVCYYQARSILSETPKHLRFLNPEGISKRRFDPLPHGYREGLIVVEGGFKALAVAAQGWRAIGIFGTDIPTATEIRTWPDPVVGMLDVDENQAGQAAQVKLRRAAERAGRRYLDMVVPGGCNDPDEALKQMGPTAFTRAIQAQIQAQMPALARAA